MKKIIDNFQDLKVIERVMFSCFGKNGRCTLIQLSNDNSFILTNDGTLILNNLAFSSDNQLCKLLLKSINQHSKVYGDNSKSLVIYIGECLRFLFENYTSDNLDTIKHKFRTQSTSLLVQSVSSKLKDNQAEFFEITPKNFLEYSKNLCVLNDLNCLNRNVSKLANNLVMKLLDAYFANNKCFNSIHQLKTALICLLESLEFSLVYSDKNSLQNSRVFEKGFLLSSKFCLNNIKSGNFRGLFILKSNQDDSLTANIDIKSLDTITKVPETQFFPKTFLESLKSRKINLIFYQGSISEFKKQQLNVSNISLVCYLNIEFIEFICQKLRIQPLYEDLIHHEIVMDTIERCIVKIETIELIESENLYYYKLTDEQSESSETIAFIYFCSPIKSFFSQFKNYILKVIKTMLCLFGGENSNFMIKCNTFEPIMIKILSELELKSNNKSELGLNVFWRFLKALFQSLDSKINGVNFISSLRKLKVLHQENLEIEFYEPLYLKLAVFNEMLIFTQTILKLDCICFVKSKIQINSITEKNQSDDE